MILQPRHQGEEAMRRKVIFAVTVSAATVALLLWPLQPLQKRGQPPKLQSEAAQILAATVLVHARGCGAVIRDGLGVLVAGDLVLTAAHVVSEGQPFLVSQVNQKGSGHSPKSAALVYFDPVADIALLRIHPVLGHRHVALPLRINTDRHNSLIPRGSKAALVVVRQGTPAVRNIDIVRPVQLETSDRYGKGRIKRLGYEIRASALPGDSGSPIVMNGEVVGVLWSRSTVRTDRAWATDTGEIEALLRQQPQLSLLQHSKCPESLR
jgi:S1-C subfamily serine protease